MQNNIKENSKDNKVNKGRQGFVFWQQILASIANPRVQEDPFSIQQLSNLPISLSTLRENSQKSSIGSWVLTSHGYIYKIFVGFFVIHRTVVNGVVKSYPGLRDLSCVHLKDLEVGRSGFGSEVDVVWRRKLK